MKKKFQLYLLGAFGAVSGLMYLHLMHPKLYVLGIIFLVGYFIILTFWWQQILHHVFRFEKGFVSTLLALFASIFFVSNIEAIVLVFYTTTPFLTWVSLTFAGCVTYFLRIFFLSRSHGSKMIGKGRRQFIEVFPRMKWLSWLYIALWVATFILFVRANGIGLIFSPWQSLHSWILPLMFVLTAILGFLIFSKQKTKHILVLILMHSFLLHVYLPLSHELPWGGDVWRHIAVESQLVEGEFIQPVLFGPEAKWREVVGVDVPEAFLIPQKYTYGQFWSLAVITKQFTGISLENINIWMIPIMWSLIFPLILFRIGRIIFRSWRGGLFFAWLSFFAFPLQVLGALTLPVSLGVLSFFFTLMLWLQYLGRRHTVQAGLLDIFVFLTLFGYSLAFLLMLSVVIGSSILHTISKRVRSATVGWSLVVLVFFLGIFLIPTVEVVFGISNFPERLDVISEAKQISGQLFGWYYASDIRPHDIASGNLFFNHTPEYAFVSSVFTAWRWWIVPFMVFLWIVSLYGLYRFVREKQPLRFLLPAWFFVLLGGSYKIGWFFLEGDRLFTRRLDPFLSTMVILFFCIGLLAMFYNIRYKSFILKRFVAIALIFIITWFGMSSYASGPDMRTASVDEYAVATFVWNDIKESRNEHCILADTWILLPLEGLSAGKIVGGNFPIGYQFGQEERVSFYNKFLTGEVTTSTVQDVFRVAQQESCMVILPAGAISEEQETSITLFALHDPIRYSGFVMWILRADHLNTLK